MSVNVVVNFRAIEGDAEALLELLQQGRDMSRAADGCELFDLYRREDDPQRFMFFEQWSSIEAHHANMATNIVASGHLSKMLPLLDGGIDNGVVTAV